ncbi:MAG TPA: GNAT family N-acetyltransferase [Ktedonobacterales bacterium]|nr:GNAT family N-acetyltransferase [Ktedonobacterales bacterium]
MTGGASEGLVQLAALSAAQAAEVVQLAARCNARDGLDLKLAIEEGTAPDGAPPRAFLAYAAGALVGYAALDYGGGIDAELCGMVHPAHRRHGIGRALLGAARAACPALGVTELLLICEAASVDGLRFAEAVAARARFAEHHMERAAELAGAPAFATPALAIAPATHDDVDSLVRILVGAFGRLEARERDRVEGALAAGRSHYYLARLGGEPVGAVHVIPMGARMGIYGFGVSPAHQGRGIGRAFLAQLMALLAAVGATRFALEVDTTNAAAQAVYRACGFATTTTYGYYPVAL